jgi:large subunit ribosomal protein L18
MKSRKSLNQIRKRRVNRNRVKVLGTKVKPRLAIFRSNRFIYAQIIDDDQGKTLASASSRNLGEENSKKKKIDNAKMVGELIAKEAKKIGVNKAVFDRRSYKYHGRIKAVADGAREAGLII